MIQIETHNIGPDFRMIRFDLINWASHRDATGGVIALDCEVATGRDGVDNDVAWVINRNICAAGRDRAEIVCIVAQRDITRRARAWRESNRTLARLTFQRS